MFDQKVKVFAHGFVNAADGRKMSKSYNNAVDPYEVYLSVKVYILLLSFLAHFFVSSVILDTE
jgi:isoleucyl-tRNA synthetase